MKILNLENENRKFTKSIENFHVMEYLQDSSVSPMTAMEEYYCLLYTSDAADEL